MYTIYVYTESHKLSVNFLKLAVAV